MSLGLSELFKQAGALPARPLLGDYYAMPGEKSMNFFSDVAAPMAWFVTPGGKLPTFAATMGAELLGSQSSLAGAMKQIGQQGFNMGWANPFLQARSGGS